MLAVGVEPTAALWTEVMCAYTQGGLLQEALDTFWRMRERLGVDGFDIRAYNTALAVCGRDSELSKEAVRIWDDINASRYEADETTMLLMITAMGKAGRLDYVQRLFHSIKARGLPLKVEAFNAVMAAHAVARDFPGAASTFAEISKEGLQPTAVSYNTLLKACQRSGEGAHAAIVFERMIRAGFKPDGPSYTSLLSALESSGQAQLALEAFAQMKSSGLLAKGGPYVPFWYAKVIGACTAGDMNEAALRRGFEMRFERITPTPEALLNLLKAAETLGAWREALVRFEELKEVLQQTRGEDTKGHAEKCNVAATYASTRPPKKASPEQPRGTGVRAGVGAEAYNFVIGACSGGGEVRRAMELFKEMKADGVIPTLGTYARVIRALQEAGEWERAMEVYNSIPPPMEDRSLSSIEPRKKAL